MVVPDRTGAHADFVTDGHLPQGNHAPEAFSAWAIAKRRGNDYGARDGLSPAGTRRRRPAHLRRRRLRGRPPARCRSFPFPAIVDSLPGNAVAAKSATMMRRGRRGQAGDGRGE